jgi:hypothetical protein
MTSSHRVAQLCEKVYLLVFTVEMLLKIVASGFLFNKEAYLRDGWCRLDFLVVASTWLLIIFPAFGNLMAIRSVRALRPLRALRRVPGMPVLVGAIMTAIPKLVNVGMLLAGIFVVVGIVGVEFFKGSMHYRCASPGAPMLC